MVVLVLLKIKFGRTQISVPKIGISMSKTACINPCKESQDWLKIDLNAAEIITVQDYKPTKNECEWKYTYTVLKLRVKQVT